MDTPKPIIPNRYIAYGRDQRDRRRGGFTIGQFGGMML
jgi:hypothetical protein